MELTEIERLIVADLPHAFFTGTFAWQHKNPCDIDVVTSWDKGSLVKYLAEKKYKYKTNGGSLGSVVIKDTRLNVITTGDCVDYNAWLLATRIMGLINPVQSRDKRHGLFEALRALVKMGELTPREGGLPC